MNNLIVIGGLILASIGGLGALFYWVRRAGGDARDKALGAQNVEAAARIAEGRQTFPSDSDDLLDELSNGKRKL